MLAAALREHFGRSATYQVLTSVRWQPFEKSLDVVEVFDVAVVPAESGLSKGRVWVPPRERPVTLIDVVVWDGYEEEFYSRPELLLHSSAYEYVLWDPTREVLRPSLQALRKYEGCWQTLRTCQRMVFFSSLGYRLDVSGSVPLVTPTDLRRYEELLLEAQLQKEQAEKVGNRDALTRLACRIADLERRCGEIPQRDQE